MNNFNMPPQLFQMLMSRNPQQVAMSLLQKNSASNPMLQNVLNMAQSGNTAGIEQIARNLCRSKGVNPDELMRNLSQYMK